MKGWMWFVLVALPGAGALVSAPGCEGKFDGPYACAPGFASCTTPNECETDTTTDGAHCGGCVGMACPAGAPCVKGMCGLVPAHVSTPSAPYGIAIAGSLPVWVTSPSVLGGGSELETFSTKGSAPRTLAMLQNAGPSCGSGGGSMAPPLFAVDSANVYYVSNNGGSVFVSQPIAGGTAATLASPDTSSGCIKALVVNGGTLYYAGSGNNGGTTFSSVSTSGGGGGPTMIASQSNGGAGGSFVVSGGTLYFPACESNGPCGVLASVPVGGGSVVYGGSAGQDNGGPVETAITADADNVYTVQGSWSCPGENGNDAGADAGFFTLTGGTTVTKFPLNGGSPIVLATTQDGSQALGAAVDSSNVYWVTSTTAWSVPLGGGTATPIAGNLWANTATGGMPTSAGPCSNAAPNPVSIASDGTKVYIADPANAAIYVIHN